MASEDGSGEEDTKVADMQVENPEIEAEKEAESNPNPNHTQPDSVMADKEEAEQEEGVDKAEQDVEKDQEEQDVEKEEEKETEEAEEEKEEEETSKKGSGMKTPVSRKRRGEVKESTIERPSRERKTVERYTETSLARGSATKPFSIEKGKRMMLKDIPNVAFKLSKIKPDDNLQLLHNILFGKRMKVHTLKKNIGLFSGFVWAENEEKQRTKIKERIDKCQRKTTVFFVISLTYQLIKPLQRRKICLQNYWSFWNLHMLQLKNCLLIKKWSLSLSLSLSHTHTHTQTNLFPLSLFGFSLLIICCSCLSLNQKDKKRNRKARSSKSPRSVEEASGTLSKELMPGGVNSPVRAFKSVGGQPIVIDSVKGSHMWDIDGNEYIDYVGSWGPAIIGHADDEVLKALAERMKKGTSFGAPCLLENVLAEMVISAVPSIEMVRFVNSGTEACMGVLRLARAFTGRQKIIKFEGCYHGHADPFLVKAGSGVATLGLPDSPGVPKAATYDTLTSPYNDIQTVTSLFEEHKGEIAAIILEPVVGNSGFITPTVDFLNASARSQKGNDTLLIFDEVMTGFRLSYGGAQEYFGITPDLTTLGKIIGGGLPVGAYGGRREIMEMVAPAGPMYQAGTLSGNPLAMTAGIHTLKRLKQAGNYEYLDKITSELINGILEAGKNAGHAICGGYISGMFGFFFTEGPVYNFDDAKKCDTAKFAKFYRGMLEEGVYFAPSQFEAGFTSLAHSSEDIQRTIAAADKVLRQL